MKKYESTLDVIFRTNQETPEIVDTASFDICTIKDIELPKQPAIMAELRQTAFLLNAAGEMKKHERNITYLVGHIEEAENAREYPEDYKIGDPDSFIETCPDGLMAVYTTPSGNKRVTPYTEDIKLFNKPEQLVAATLNFATNFLAMRESAKDIEPPKVYKK